MDGRFFEQFIQDYFAEVDEHLGVLRRALLAIEDAGSTAPAAAALTSLARSLHTIKGLSGMVGLTSAERTAHAMEEVVRGVTVRGAAVDRRELEALFDGARLLERCIAARKRGDDGPPTLQLDAELQRLVDVRPADAHLGPAAGGDEARPDEPASPAARTTVDAARNESGAPAEADIYHFAFASSRDLAKRGIGVESVRRRLGEIGVVLDVKPRMVDSGSVVFDFSVAVNRGAALDESWRADGITWSLATDATPTNGRSSGHDGTGTAGDAAVPPAGRIPAAATSSETPPIPEPASAAGAGLGGSNLIRVDLARLDDVMRLVGELVVSRARLDELLPRAASGDAAAWDALGETNTLMERQLRGMREGVTRIRAVPVGEVFERLRFAARDVAREAGKQVVLELSGQDTEVDKAVVDRMLEPLMHLVRNAVSHGLEMPAERLTRGKPAEGRLSLRASTAGDRIVVEVQDDGAGIDAGQVAARARSLGIAVDEAAPGASLLDLLSAPGFSTRDEADMASGRGVGMAVVRSTVRALGGELSVTTEPGTGTCFAIELPLTLMIVDALLVEVGGQRMAVPQPVLREILQIEPQAVTRFENNDVMAYRGGALPLLGLRRLFGMPDDASAGRYVLVVGDGQPAGLVVDRLLGIREIVVHTLADPLVALPGIGGATELGDGRVSLILDTAALVRLAHERREQQSLRRRRATDDARTPMSEDGPPASARYLA